MTEPVAIGFACITVAIALGTIVRVGDALGWWLGNRRHALELQTDLLAVLRPAIERAENTRASKLEHDLELTMPCSDPGCPQCSRRRPYVMAPTSTERLAAERARRERHDRAQERERELRALLERTHAQLLPAERITP